MMFEKDTDAFVMTEIVAHKDDPSTLGVVVGTDVITPVSFSEVKLWENAAGDFKPIGKSARILDTFSRDVARWKAPGHSADEWNPNTWPHYGSHLRGAFKEAGVLKG